MPPVDEAAVPPARKARQAFINALENWDAPAADPAIGHKIIFAANGKRTLDCIGWQHAEPVLRSLAYALMSYSGDNPAKRDDIADRSGRKNRELAKEIPDSWQE